MESSKHLDRPRPGHAWWTSNVDVKGWKPVSSPGIYELAAESGRVVLQTILQASLRDLIENLMLSRVAKSGTWLDVRLLENPMGTLLDLQDRMLNGGTCIVHYTALQCLSTAKTKWADNSIAKSHAWGKSPKEVRFFISQTGLPLDLTLIGSAQRSPYTSLNRHYRSSLDQKNAIIIRQRSVSAVVWENIIALIHALSQLHRVTPAEQRSSRTSVSIRTVHQTIMTCTVTIIYGADGTCRLRLDDIHSRQGKALTLDHMRPGIVRTITELGTSRQLSVLRYAGGEYKPAVEAVRPMLKINIGGAVEAELKRMPTYRRSLLQSGTNLSNTRRRKELVSPSKRKMIATPAKGDSSVLEEQRKNSMSIPKPCPEKRHQCTAHSSTKQDKTNSTSPHIHTTGWLLSLIMGVLRFLDSRSCYNLGTVLRRSLNLLLRPRVLQGHIRITWTCVSD